MHWQRVLAVDPSLTCSGWALFHIGSNTILGVGKVKSLSPKLPMSNRLSDLQIKIRSIYRKLDLGHNDIVICEAQTTMIDPKAAFKVEGVRGIFEVIARESRINVPGRINPRSVQTNVMGLYGRQLARKHVKETAVATVKSLYQSELENIGFNCDVKNLKKHQDIVDAVLIGSLAVAKIKEAAKADLGIEAIFGL